MARTSTDATERTAQNHRLVAEVSTELGIDAVTVRAAQEHRRKTRGVSDIVARQLDLNDANVKPIGVVLGTVGEYRARTGTGHLTVTTNSREFKEVLLDASELSGSELLVMALYYIPRNLGLDDKEGDDGSED